MAAAPQAAQTSRAVAASNTLVGTTCMELALEGERLCKSGDFMNGIGFFEEAIKVGTNDDRTLSAIYSQLGNAYFYMEDYTKALYYHEKDVVLIHNIGDEIAEAKACGNLGNTFKMLDKFDEAIAYCRRYLEISRKLGDQVGEGRALYNLGNVFHTRGKRMIGANEQEPGQLSNDIKSSLQKAVEYYEQNLHVVTKLKDHTSMGRAYGNLGNTHYLLGNFKEAVESHKERLRLAKETHDKLAERRAYLNLGNANVFLGNFSEAIENHTAALKLAQELQDRNTEAHSCYSLANTYTFLRDYQSAINYHLKYLEMIKELQDKLGEGRACWSLVNVYQMVNDPESALKYAKLHKEIAEQLGDKDGLSSAKLNIQELEEIISQKQAVQWAPNEPVESCSTAEGGIHHQQHGGKKFAPEGLHYKLRLTPDKRQEQEQRRFKKQLNSNLTVDVDALLAAKKRTGGVIKSNSSEQLLDMIAHFQSGRIDDQRCEILKKPIGEVRTALSRPLDDKENLIDSTGLRDIIDNPTKSSTGHVFGRDVVTRASQPILGNPLHAVSAAASAIKATYRKASLANYPATSIIPQPHRRPTVSAEHRDQLFDLIAGAQKQRMEEQRATLPNFAIPSSIQLQSRRTQASSQSSGSSSLVRGHTVDKSDHISPIDRNQSSARPSLPYDAMDESNFNKPTSSESGYLTRNPSANSSNRPKLNRQFQTMDADHHHQSHVHDEKFLDNLMKYQSTRFDDQRSEIPSRPPTTGSKSNPNDFFNLIVRFQSDRLDDQRSTPVSSTRK